MIALREPKTRILFRCLPVWLAACLLLAASVARGLEATKPLKIKEVRFEGIRTLTEAELLRKIESRPDTDYDVDHARADVKRLAAIAWNWPALRVDDVKGGVRLTFTLRENPTLESIRIVGNSKIDTAELEKSLRVKPGDVLTRDLLVKAKERIGEEYRAMGYVRTQVGASLAKSATTLDRAGATEKRILQVVINEGQKKRIDKLILEGNDNFSAMRLKAVLETKSSWFFIKNYFDETVFEDDLKVLEQFYHRNGFFDARVEPGVFTEDKAEETITPSIVIYEGPRYRFGRVKSIGSTYFNPEEVEIAFARLRGDFFDADAYEMALKKVRDLYGDAGFVTTEVRDTLDFDKEKGEVIITLSFDEKTQAKVGRILIERVDVDLENDASWFARTYYRMAPPIDKSVILREVALKPGDVYDKSREDETLNSLRDLGVFDEVDIRSQSTDEPGVRDVVIKVEEGVTGNIFVGLGYSESFGAYVWGRYTERNLLGQADSLQVNVMGGTREINAGVTYFDRHFQDSDMDLLLEARHLNADRPGFDETNTGVLAEVGIPLSEKWKTYVRGRLEYVQIDDAGNEPEEDFNVDYPVAALRLRLTHDDRIYENYQNARSRVTGGHFASAAIEGGYADGTLAKLTAQYNMFQKIGDKLVFSSDWQAGVMPVDANEIGPSERFYLGGTKDLRGFKFRHAGPHDRQDDEVPLGGATKILTRNELRYPLASNVSAIYFIDGGMLDHDAFNFSSPRFSTGFGVRLDLKGVQAGVDLALPLNAKDDDQKRYFHLSLTSLKGF